MGDVVGKKPNAALVEPGQRRLQESGRLVCIEGAKPFPFLSCDVAIGRRRQRRVVRIHDGIEVGWSDPGFAEAPPSRFLRQFPGGKRNGLLAVLTPREALLFGRCDDPSIDDQGRRGVVEDRVDAKNSGQREIPLSGCWVVGSLETAELQLR
jgi:hypothetical protein